MTARELCEYIAHLDYWYYHDLLNNPHKMSFINVSYHQRNLRHIMYLISFDMIMKGDY